MSTFRNQVEADSDEDRGAVTYPLPGGVLVERDIWVQMRDGVRLNATVFRPEVEGRYPVIMCVTVYGKDRCPNDYSTLPKIRNSGNAVGTLRISDVTPWEAPDPGFWVPNGYVVLVADARGYYRSEGEAGIYSEKDPEDYEDLIGWAGVQPWSTGAVGLSGVSYLAISQWMCASTTKPAHLKAIVLWEGASDLLRDIVEHGGIPETRFLPGYYSGSLARGAGEAVAERGQKLIEASARHPFPLETIEVPALVCGSWSLQGLHSRGAFEGFMRISSKRKWLYTHGGCEWDRYYSADAVEWQKASTTSSSARTTASTGARPSGSRSAGPRRSTKSAPSGHGRSTACPGSGATSTSDGTASPSRPRTPISIATTIPRPTRRCR